MSFLKQLWEYGKESILVYVAIMSVFLTLTMGAWVVRSHFEAQTYSELTGKTVTTWQALWVDLRVIEPALSNEE